MKKRKMCVYVLNVAASTGIHNLLVPMISLIKNNQAPAVLSSSLIFRIHTRHKHTENPALSTFYQAVEKPHSVFQQLDSVLDRRYSHEAEGNETDQSNGEGLFISRKVSS
jgi:hypothetical protein